MAVTEVSSDNFRTWLKEADTKKMAALTLGRYRSKAVTPPAQRAQNPPDVASLPPGFEIVESRVSGAPNSTGSRAATANAAPPRVNSFAPGANYVGFINDSAPPPTGSGGAAVMPAGSSASPSATQKAPIRREDILRPFLKALGVPLYEGRVKRKGVQGFYYPKSEAVRIKNKSDLETAAHELTHLIDDIAPMVVRTKRKNLS
jgi:hypothetical protein